jgi:hypothetical protein
MSKRKGNIAKIAFGFVLVIGIVNFFADLTNEGCCVCLTVCRRNICEKALTNFSLAQGAM